MHKHLFRLVRPFVLALSLGLPGYYLILTQESFQVREILVMPTRHVEIDEIRSILTRAIGQNLLLLDLRPYVDEITARPWVADVRIRKKLHGLLVVQVLERTPLAVVRSGKDRYLVDGAGVIASALAGYPEDLPRIEGIDLHGLLRKDSVQLERLAYGVELIQLVERHAKGRPRQGPLVLDLRRGERDPRIHLDGYVLRIGYGGFEEKWARFLSIYHDLETKGLASEEIDLRFNNQVIVKTF